MKEKIIDILRFIGWDTIGVLLAIFLFAQCAPEKRLNRLVKKHPELLNKQDTLKFYDTIVTRSHHADTLVSIFSATHDTIYLRHENITTKVYVHRDSLYIFSHAAADTIIRYIERPYNQIAAPPALPWYRNKWVLIVAGIWSLVAGLLVVSRIFK